VSALTPRSAHRRQVDVLRYQRTTLGRAKENLASAKIVKIEFNANLDLLGFPHFITFKECRNCLEIKENDTKEFRPSNSVFLNVITSSLSVIFPKLFREELLGVSNLG